MGNNEEKIYHRSGYKKALIVGIIVFAVQYGVCVAIWDNFNYVQIVSQSAWFLMFFFVTYLVIRAQKISLNAPIIVRFIFFSVLGLAFLWFAPWIELAEVGTTSGLGDLSFLLLRPYLSVVFCSMTLFGVAYCSILPGKTIRAIDIVRFLLVALLSAIIGVVFGIAIFLLSQLTPLSEAAFFFIDGLGSQLLCGITYYYAIGLLLDKSKPARLSINE